jgi:hypothetical protein
LAQLLELRREAEQEEEDITEDEDGCVIPPLRAASSYAKEQPVLDPKYDSRSRFYLELDRLSKYHESRLAATSILESQMDKIRPNIDQEFFDMESGLGQIDTSRREQSIMQLNIHALADAAEEIETHELETKKAISERQPLSSDGFGALLEAIEFKESTYPGLETGEDVKPQPHTLMNSIYASQPNTSPQYLQRIPKKEESVESSGIAFGIQSNIPIDGAGYNISYNTQNKDSMRDSYRGGENRIQRRMNLSDMLSSDPRSPTKESHHGHERGTQRTLSMSSRAGASTDTWATPERNQGQLPGIKAFRNPFGPSQSSQTVPMFDRGIVSPIRTMHDRFSDQLGYDRPMQNVYDAPPPEANHSVNEPTRNRARASTLPTTQGGPPQIIHYQGPPTEGTNAPFTPNRLEPQSQPPTVPDEVSRPPPMSAHPPNAMPPGPERGPEFERRVTISGPEALHHVQFPNHSIHPPTHPQRGQFYTPQTENLPPPGYPYPAGPPDPRYQAYPPPPPSGQPQWQPQQGTQMSPPYPYHNAPPPEGYPTHPQPQFYGPRIAPAPPPSWHSSPVAQQPLHHHHHAPPQQSQESEPPRPSEAQPTVPQQHDAQIPASTDYQRHGDAVIETGARASGYELPRLAPAFEHRNGSGATEGENPQDNGVRVESEKMEIEPSPNRQTESSPPYSYGEDEDEHGDVKNQKKLQNSIKFIRTQEFPPP